MLLWFVMRLGYLFTSYVSTKAMNPSGNAIAKEISAANSPSLASSGPMSSRVDNFWRQSMLSWRRSFAWDVFLHCSRVLRNSSTDVNEVMYEWAWVPFTGMLNNLPARTLLVPSKPPIFEKYCYFKLSIKI